MSVHPQPAHQPASPAMAAEDALQPWRSARLRQVGSLPGQHCLHSYFNTCPESPVDRRVLAYISPQSDGHRGRLALLDGAEPATVSWLTDEIAVEDAHRQAAQQWACNGQAIAYMRAPETEAQPWEVRRIDLASGTDTVLATDRQLFFGHPSLPVVPLMDLPWAPQGPGDLELLDLRDGSITTALTREQVIDEHRELIATLFPDRLPDSIAFPFLSPDGTRVCFKLSAVRDGRYRSSAGSSRQGKFVYDISGDRPRSLGSWPHWGHPTWLADSRHILDKTHLLDTDTQTIADQAYGGWLPTTANLHPSVSVQGLAAIDVGRLPYTAQDLHWAVVIGAPGAEGSWLTLHSDPAPRDGTTSWRPAHPHPVFSDDGQRLYFNANHGERMILTVAEAAPAG